MQLCPLGTSWLSGRIYKMQLRAVDILLQDMEKCSPEGRDCFERNFRHSFNCTVTCEGVYADVQWKDEPIMKEEVEDELVGEVFEESFGEEVQKEIKTLEKKLMRMYKMYADLEKKVKLMEGNKAEEELDKEKFKRLIAEYENFKTDNVRHFRFNANATSSMFGKYSLSVFNMYKTNMNVKGYRKVIVQEKSCHTQPSSWCRFTLTRPLLTRWRETKRSRKRLS